jgi:hypothetical protein
VAEDKKEQLATVEEGTALAIPDFSQRLTTALAEVEPATLDSFHSFHKYRYTSIGQIRSLANRALARAGVAVIPAVIAVNRQERVGERGNTVWQTAVRMEFTIVAPEGRMSVPWYGESDDTSDKGLAKAITAATKSFLLNFLMVPMAQASEESEGEPSPEPEPPPEGEGQASESPPQHWLKRPEVRQRFWAWTRDELGLTDREVHEALDVKSVYDFKGSMAKAKQAINAYIDRKMEGEKGSADAEGE